MLRFNIARLQSQAPYNLVFEGDGTFTFVTAAGRHYHVGFIEDFTLGRDDCYQFFIATSDKGVYVPDEKIRDTVMILIEEFFRLNDAAILYICDTSDGRQAIRNRLFRNWYNRHSDNLQYICKTAEFQVEGVCYYATILLKKGTVSSIEFLRLFEEYIVDVRMKFGMTINVE